MNKFYFIYGIILLLFLIILMAMMVRWGVEVDTAAKKKWSKAWHGFSVLFRAGAMVLWIVSLWGQWKLLLMVVFPVFLNICWTLWDGVISLHLGQNFWYIGNTSTWDKIFTAQISMICKLILLTGSIVLIILYFTLKL